MRRLTEASAAAAAQNIASSLLAGPDSAQWQALVTSEREAERPEPNAITADVIQDVGDRPVLDRFVGWLFGADSPPATQNASVVDGSSVAVSALISSGSRDDGFRGYTIYDAGGGGALTVNGAAEPDGRWIYVPATELSDVNYVGSGFGTATIYVKAYGGSSASWSFSTSFTITSHAVPTVNVQNVAAAEDAAIPVSSLIKSISNPSNDVISEYAF